MHALLRGTAAMKLRDKLLPCVSLKTTKCSDTESSIKKKSQHVLKFSQILKNTAVNIAFKLTNAGYYASVMSKKRKKKHYKQFCVEKLQQHCKCSPFQLCLNATSSAWKKYLGISIEPPIPKLFYLSLHSVLLFIILFLFLGGKHCRWRPKHPEGDGEISGVKGEREESERDVNNRSERRTRKWERVKRRE